MSKAEEIEAALVEALEPAYVDVEDESHMHNVPKGAQSHFKVVIVSSSFDGKPLVARHRQVNGIVDMQARQIHALALHTFTPAEWSERGHDLESPDCLGGAGK